MSASAHSPDFDHVVKQFKDRYGIDLSHVKMHWSKHPRYSNGHVSHDFADDETGGSYGHVGEESVVWINPNMRSVMNRWGVHGKVKDFRRKLMAHELAHEIDFSMKKRRFVNKMLDEARRNNFTSSYLETVPKHKFDKELFAEYMARLLSQPQELKKEAAPTDAELRRMYDILQADVKFRKGKYEDVKSVFDSMNERDRRYVAPAHPDVYLNIKPDARTVAYMSGRPVGFADLYDEVPYIGEKGSRRASVEIAVMEAARRKGIARKLAIASIVKALNTGRFDDIDWNVVHGNDASVALAKKLGFRRRGIHWHPQYTIGKYDFNRANELKKEAGIELRDGGIDDVRRVIAGLSDTEQTLSKPHRFRQFVKRRRDAEKKAAAPTDDELRRMYDILQADARLANRVEGMGFGRNGDAYRRAAIKLRVMELARLLQDGKRIRNRIVHTPGYVPSEQDSKRALKQYADADAKITQFLHPQEKAAAEQERT